MYLFSRLKITLAGQMVEHVNYPGQATSLLGLATYSPDYSKECGLIQGWNPDINANAAAANIGFAIRRRFLKQSPDPTGSFQYAIPMRHVFGFTDDYTKVIYALFHTAATGARKVVLSKLACIVPIVQPNDVLKVNLYRNIAANNTIPVGFRRRQFQTFTLPQARSTVRRLGVSSAPQKPRLTFLSQLTHPTLKMPSVT